MNRSHAIAFLTIGCLVVGVVSKQFAIPAASNQASANATIRFEPETSSTASLAKNFLDVESINQVKSMWGFREHARILIRCEGDHLQASIQTPSYNNNLPDVSLSWGEESAKPAQWDASDNSYTAPDSRAFILDLMAHNKLGFSWNDYQGKTNQAIFDVRGIGDYIQDFRRLGCYV